MLIKPASETRSIILKKCNTPVMQKAFQLFFIATVLSGATGVKAQDTEDFKPSGRLFGLLFTNYHNTFSGGRSIAVFEVNRAFFGYDYAFSKTISGRILYDGTAQVYSGKSMITGYLRNAYLQYDNGKITVRGGLITPEQVLILEKFWTYRYLFPPFIERAGMAFSAEPGASFKYKPSELVAMDFALLNGRGFRDVLPDTTLRVAAGITLNPAKKLFFRGYIDAMGPRGRLQWTAGFMGAYRREKFYLGVECLYQHIHLMTDGDN